MTVQVGDSATLTQTVTSEVLRIFCDVTGDHDPLHVDEEFARTTPYGRLIAPGGLIVGWMLAAAARTTGHHPFAVPSIGFDRIRHAAPVFIDDTVTVTYVVADFDGIRGRADVVASVAGSTVAVAVHVFKVFV